MAHSLDSRHGEPIGICEMSIYGTVNEGYVSQPATATVRQSPSATDKGWPEPIPFAQLLSGGYARFRTRKKKFWGPRSMPSTIGIGIYTEHARILCLGNELEWPPEIVEAVFTAHHVIRSKNKKRFKVTMKTILVLLAGNLAVAQIKPSSKPACCATRMAIPTCAVRTNLHTLTLSCNRNKTRGTNGKVKVALHHQ